MRCKESKKIGIFFSTRAKRVYAGGYLKTDFSLGRAPENSRGAQKALIPGHFPSSSGSNIVIISKF
jgi:hypothetical protein